MTNIAAPAGIDDFLPSKILVDLFKAGLEAHLPELGTETSSDPDDTPLPPNVANELKRRLADDSMNLVIGQEITLRTWRHFQFIADASASPDTTRIVFVSKTTQGFEDRVVDALRKQIPAPPRQIREFFDNLHEELFVFLRKTGEIGGAWGSLGIENNRIRMIVAPLNSRESNNNIIRMKRTI